MNDHDEARPNGSGPATARVPAVAGPAEGPGAALPPGRVGTADGAAPTAPPWPDAGDPPDLRRQWPVAAVAVLGALVAFGCSFLVEPTFTSSTRLLIRGRDTRFLTSSGQNLSGQPGVVDASLSKALAETYAGIATSREVATATVDRLHLDRPGPARTGPLAAASAVLAGTYRCARAYVTYGYCATPDAHEQAVLDTQEGTIAAQLGSTVGEAAGQPGSYVLEIAGSGSTPARARTTTDTIADELVRVSADRFRQDARRHAGNLADQLRAADAELERATTEISRYKTANHITAVDEELALAAADRDAAGNDLRRLDADIAQAEAQLASVGSSLEALPAEETSEQVIRTGRSESGISTRQPSPLFTQLQGRRSELQAQLAGLRARQSRLRGATDPAAVAPLNEKQAGLSVLQQRLEGAKANQADLTRRHQEAVTNASSDTVELTRIDRAGTPTYPEAPRRHLYLALGTLLGALAGAGLTWLAGRRDGAGTDRPAAPTGASRDHPPASGDGARRGAPGGPAPATGARWWDSAGVVAGPPSGGERPRPAPGAGSPGGIPPW